jgi:4-amino-4-deoxy-L-arabinose transferase-like glycosyltransferase
MTGDWRDYRPAIWLAMLGVGLALALNTLVLAAPFLGAAIGVAIRIWQRRRAAGGR